MAKRPFPLIPDAYMVPEIELSDAHKGEILAALGQPETAVADSVLAEVQEILAQLQADRVREPKVRETVAQLDALAASAENLHVALGDIGPMADGLLVEQITPLESGSARPELSRSVFKLSVRARRAAEEIRPERGRPPAWPERLATMALADLWERRTGERPTWANGLDDGGPFARFVQAVSPEIGLGVMRATLTARGRKSKKST